MSGRWWKAPAGALNDRRLQRMPPATFRVWFNLCCLASLSGGVLPPAEDTAFALRVSEATLARRLDALRTAGLIAEGEGGETIVVGAVETGDRANDDRPAPMTAAERTRRWRESRRERDGGDEAGDDAVTPVTRLEEETEKRDSDSSRVTRGVSDDSSFEKFWSAYPARDGDNPRQPAEAAFRKAIAAGADPEALIDGARRYAAAVAGREGRYIASAVRWITERRWEGSKPATTSTPAAEMSGFWIAADSDAGRAWASFYRETKGRTPPTDGRGGWRFPSLMPPTSMTEVAA